MDAMPVPHELRACTGTIVASLATPSVVPAMMPATWVPWPLLSVVPFAPALSVRSYASRSPSLYG